MIGRFVFICATLMSFEAFSVECGGLTTQMQIGQCVDGLMAQSEGAVEGMYNQIYNNLDDERKPLFKYSQEAWKNYRDKTCELEGKSTDRGSMHGIVIGMCRRQMAEDRASKLRWYITCTDADSRCITKF